MCGAAAARRRSRNTPSPSTVQRVAANTLRRKQRGLVGGGGPTGHNLHQSVTAAPHGERCRLVPPSRRSCTFARTAALSSARCSSSRRRSAVGTAWHLIRTRLFLRSSAFLWMLIWRFSLASRLASARSASRLAFHDSRCCRASMKAAARRWCPKPAPFAEVGVAVLSRVSASSMSSVVNSSPALSALRCAASGAAAMVGRGCKDLRRCGCCA